MLKPYNELVKLDVTPFCSSREEKDAKGNKINIQYLNWATCVQLLHDNGAETVFFEPIVNENGSSLFFAPFECADKNGNVNRCYEVGVHIKVDDLEFDMRGPLMNGTNPVKDNSLSQQRIWNCQTRLFVKGIAIMTGLGFQLWQKEETAIPETTIWDDLENHSLAAVKTRIERLITTKLDGGVSLEEIAIGTKIGTTADDVRELVRSLAKVGKFEEALRKL